MNAAGQESNSPFLTPCRNARNPAALHVSTAPPGCRELRTATRRLDSSASSTHAPLGLLCRLLRHWSDAVPGDDAPDVAPDNDPDHPAKSCMKLPAFHGRRVPQPYWPADAHAYVTAFNLAFAMCAAL